MIKVTNPILPFDASKGEKNPNFTIAGTAKNGEAEIRLAFPPGETATVDGNQALPKIVPVWVWNAFRDSPVGTNYIKSQRLLVDGDKESDKIVRDYKKSLSDAKAADKPVKTQAGAPSE